jgi:hypothetical protein
MARLIHLPLAWGVGYIYILHEMTRGVIPKALAYYNFVLNIMIKQESNLSDSTARNGMLPSATYIRAIFVPPRWEGKVYFQCC